MKTGVVDVGGGLRGIYGAGVFDYCLLKEIKFDECIGVSAGSANIVAYLAGQRGRNLRYYRDYAFRPNYMSLHNLVHGGSYLDLNYVYGVLSNSDGEYPLDYPKIVENPAEMKVVASEAVSGRVKYFDKNDFLKDDYGILGASSAIPVVCRPYPFHGTLYFDGALSDPVPVQKALQDGCERVVVILTKPRNLIRTSSGDDHFVRILRRRYPKAARNLHLRAKRYNEGVAFAKALEKKGKAVIIAPDQIAGINTLTKNKNMLEHLYQKGFKDAEAIEAFLGQ
ncbi:MAG: patatin family protein [Clostridiales bacterium]|nr:patatin family protein [Clostridiales bacterium]MCI2160909.1 patatin family protein [Oscillospiraceae bacterium]MCI1961980.1 patatin family protein [Clostridiales bacterium]MCI2022287.1 patatin family protein [Clostridiales bacterium]MCI2026684.1 patatin family protein [Clostridiales bacterium]